ncbi:tRNA pseudouridine(38-40) synthase TruA [candidate division WOR-1 bacterium RIFOXYA12_FULL_52_29]|uniref:tRNA pseudouridine synthase A n=1 Tax=candidate division WOR-1 bacterium RIFOXYC12_FULL_54_18 TaxID=1802584 RepID=A0A1F4T7Y3_UNCSA|nr:MAG: tRNA pseudouridine(38-40) synthase TruA [candidate division WOR-1 bacterium RIFOXYA2_FULL_51_19]OGC18445.1 MAG: tRNA pseudouridine(38-40) synthase TruA [candidate division WOR-1 bacterium RIFOXYA12_FULL_52_29]OGC27299.1 MAG: tRNA pseudouridine(38-40) synthase TruA [candidate division WOR-1 bacterium RIFOXYB2_FULL_45_9]OGC28862.1 MAG: tRNA pseudouridine(38-40) synthase TruA [candidate division WOR-1 bacterium RIFOXYC12_FULL_54_18]OGC30629.1 MAG: tRNA pseudouridine(38-40) synthase TruA [c
MVNHRLVVQYDGAGFEGFASQVHGRTVQDELEKALAVLYKRPVKVLGTSRTDSGVHAIAQVVSYQAKPIIPFNKLPLALNSLLPESVRVFKAEKAPDKFVPRFAAKSKTYEYLIFNGQPIPPAVRRFAWQVKPKLDLKAMRRGGAQLLGRHDFSAFRNAGGEKRNAVRDLRGVWVRRKKIRLWDGFAVEVISLKFQANGFLYRMVRNLVGTLVDIGTGKLETKVLPVLLKKKDRRPAGRTAPPQGLCLIKVVN